MAITSRELRGRLEDAYAASAGLVPATSLRAYLRTQEQGARALIASGAIESSTSDGRSMRFASYGPGQITPTEVAELYRTLVDDFDAAFLFLANCCNAGLDAFLSEFTIFPTIATGAQPVVPAIIVDGTGRWNQLCVQFGVAANLIVGAVLSDKAIFLWMMFHEVPALEIRSDYGQMRIASGAQFT